MTDIQFREFTGGEIRDANDDERSFTHAISDESVDGHGSVIKVAGWDLKRFTANPVVLFAHDSLALPIGRALKVWKDDGRLMTRTQFAGTAQAHPFAESAYRLVRDGFLRAWSVGFRPTKSEPRKDITEREKFTLFDPTVHLEQELMEYSLVPVPSNPNALLAARAAGHNLDPVMEWFSRHRAVAVFAGVTGIEETPPADPLEPDLDLEAEIFRLILNEQDA